MRTQSLAWPPIVEAVLEAKRDIGQPPRNFMRHEYLPAPRGLVVKHDAVAWIHAVALAVVSGYPVTVHLGDLDSILNIGWLVMCSLTVKKLIVTELLRN